MIKHKIVLHCLALFLAFQVKAQLAPDTVIITAVGDIMPGTNYPSEIYLPPDSGRNIFGPVKDMLSEAHIVFGNLEGCLLNQGEVYKKCQDPSKCYAFRIPEYFSEVIKNAGFNLLSLANNHSGDFGDPGRYSTMAALDKAGIAYAGLNLCPSVIIEENGLKIGFCAFSPFTGTVDMLKTDTVNTIISTLDSLCDIVIVSLHAGAEGAKHTNITRQPEIFYDEDRGNVYEFAHHAIDMGADLILGHGPHVTRAAELYRDRLILYSLGNFCTYGRFNLNGQNGVAPLIQVFTDNQGGFLYAKVYSIIQKGEGGPVPDISNTAFKHLLTLSAQDFPESLLFFDSKTFTVRKTSEIVPANH